jgi:hypothetical protein
MNGSARGALLPAASGFWATKLQQEQLGACSLNFNIETSTFIYSNFAWGLHGGLDVKWSGGLLV